MSLPLRCEVTAGFDCTWLHFTRGGSLAVHSCSTLRAETQTCLSALHKTVTETCVLDQFWNSLTVQPSSVQAFKLTPICPPPHFLQAMVDNAEVDKDAYRVAEWWKPAFTRRREIAMGRIASASHTDTVLMFVRCLHSTMTKKPHCVRRRQLRKASANNTTL